MNEDLTIKRIAANHPDFKYLISLLDHELWDELKEDQATYDPFNNVSNISTGVIIYDEQNPVACGCFKVHDDDTVEIKRMFVNKNYRGRGVSKMVLHALEKWAVEKDFKHTVLETSIHFTVAKNLYQQAGYETIPNYGQYAGLEESVCMKKKLV